MNIAAIAGRFAALAALACFCGLGLLAAPSAQASCARSTTPHAAVEEVTREVLAILAETRSQAQPLESIYARLEQIVLPVFDLDSFLRGVMGYRGTVSAAEEKRRVRQLESFHEVFKKSLISTYGKGLLVFGGGSSSVVPADEETQGKIRAGKRVVVEQHIHSQGRPNYVIQYRMQYHPQACQWLVGNLMVQGVNLGKVYRSQFSSALHRNNGDVERVIAGWGHSDPAPPAGAH